MFFYTIEKKCFLEFFVEIIFSFSVKNIVMDQKLNNSNLWDGKKQKWIKDILSKSGTELKELSDKIGTNSEF